MSWPAVPAFSLRLLGALLSGLLLASCFAPMEWHFAAWFALVPILLVARYSAPWSAFRWGMVCGLAFWIPALGWLRILAHKGVPAPVAYAGWFVLAAYCAVYIAVFAMIVSAWFAACGTEDWRKNIAATVVIPLLWAGLEYLRSHFASGFPWNTLGVSQALAGNQYSTSVCQVAALGGVYAVSALIVLINAGLAVTVIRHRGVSVGKSYRAHPELTLALLCAGGAVLWGASVIARQPRSDRPNMVIAVVQPNIPQLEKWDEDFARPIYDSLDRLTSLAVRAPRPDLVVWPETSVPFPIFWNESLGFMADMLTNGVPILAGSTDDRLADKGIIYNSSILMDASGRPLQVYHKQHLAPFGEYAPFSSLFSRVVACVAPDGWTGLTPGTNTVVFRLEKRAQYGFSALICFEDAFPGLARGAVLAGARLLIDQTNDAWFDVSSGARQHLAHCVLRCIENRVPAIRAANTGVSCYIDAVGRIPVDGMLAPLSAEYLTVPVEVPPADMRLTLYTKYGDRLFALPCAALAVLSFLLAIVPIGRLTSRRLACKRVATETDHTGDTDGRG
ncbi:MAG: apolipoprotein N-acyltransferase [bacterium]